MIRTKLSVFMFLQYLLWGTWYVSMGTYLANNLRFEGEQIGAAYGAFAIGSMISPFFIGLIADRYFAAQKILACLSLAGGVVLFILGQTRSFSTFYPLLILYCALFAPTLALGNSVALRHLSDSKRDFPRVKIFSAIGWIAGGIMLSLLHGEQSAIQFQVAGAISLLFGLISLLLPDTPPKKNEQDIRIGEILGFDTLALLRKPSFAIFVGCMFLICVPLYFYFVLMSIYLTELQWSGLAAKMSLAQVSDVLFLFMLPVFLRQWGYKKTIAVGIAAWAARYWFLGKSTDLGGWQTSAIFAAILLHGVCYDFLFIAGQLYVDDEAGDRTRGAAQGFLAFILWGLGALTGTWLAGRILAANRLTVPSGRIAHDWSHIWLTPAIGSAGILVVFLLFFREPGKSKLPPLA